MDRSNGQRVYKTIMLVIIIIIITSLVTAYATYQYLVHNGINVVAKDDTSLSGLEFTLASFRSELEKKYLGEINDEELIESAIKGYVAGLGDPYTVYYTKEEMEEIMQETNGNYVGIGIYMTLNTEQNVIEVVRPMENSPAEKAGIRQGDIITKVDGEAYSGDEMDEAANKIKGEAGTKVKLEILRNGETLEFEVTREKVLISHITAKVLENNIGYIAISDFDGGCADEFETKYKKLKEQGITKLIIDIRDNGGGIVDEAIDILELMTDKGSTLLITANKNNEEEVTKSNKNPIIDMPTVVLINEYSASASEILAGALKDNEKAILVGTTTYGKGVIQELHQLSDGSGLKITTNEYFTPKHNKINEIGIEPDVEIDLSDEDKMNLNLTDEEDEQLQKAIEILKSES